MDPRASIYDLSSPLPPDYPWNQQGLSVARRLRAAIWLLRILAVATVAVACVWLLGVIEGIGIAAIFGTYAAVVAVALGLRQATLLAFGRRSHALSPDARHDYALYVYRWQGKRSKRASSQVLLSIARIDVLRSRADLALDAPGRADTQLLSPEQLKLFYLLNALATASKEAGEKNDILACGGIPSASWRDGAATDPVHPPASRRQPPASDDAATSATSGDSQRQGTREPSHPDKLSARDWLVRYSGIAATPDGGFPGDELVGDWIAGIEAGSDPSRSGGPSPRDSGAADDRWDQARAAVGGISLSRHAHPLVVAAVSLMLAHCLFYYGLDLGVDSGSGWSLRIPYATVASPLAAMFVFVMAVIAAVWLFRRGRREGLATTSTRVRSLLGGAAVVLLALVAACGTLLSAAFGYDGTERVLRTGVTDASAGETVAGESDSEAHGVPWPLGQRTYDYLAVDWAGYDPDESYTTYYRASDPLLMEPWELAQAYDAARGGQAGTLDSGDSAATGSAGGESDVALSLGDSSNGDGGASLSPTDSSDGGNGTATSAGDSEDSSGTSSNDPLGTQNQMLAVARYLDDQGIVPKMDALTFGRNAKGELYASLGTATEELDGSPVTVEYRLYDNGEATDPTGATAEELVLQKVYPHGESDTQLLGFYLVDRSTLAVTDEHRTTW